MGLVDANRDPERQKVKENRRSPYPFHFNFDQRQLLNSRDTAWIFAPDSSEEIIEFETVFIVGWVRRTCT